MRLRVASRRLRNVRGCFLDDFLVAALDGAFTLAQIDRIAECLSAEYLDFDMAGIVEEFLNENAARRRRKTRLPPRERSHSLEAVDLNSFSLRATRMPLPPPPAAALIMTG